MSEMAERFNTIYVVGGEGEKGRQVAEALDRLALVHRAGRHTPNRHFNSQQIQGIASNY